MLLDHERLDVYQLSLDFLVLANQVIEASPAADDTSPINSCAHRRRSCSTSPRAPANTLVPTNAGTTAALTGRSRLAVTGVSDHAAD
jgi:hypothetical protein